MASLYCHYHRNLAQKYVLPYICSATKLVMKKIIALFLLLAVGFSISTVLAQAYCGYTHKRVITINGSQITGGPHTDFPVLISHTDAQLRHTTSGGNVTDLQGDDISFFDDSGNQLDHDREHYNPTTGQVIFWVKASSLTNGTDYVIHMVYGNPSITTDQSTTTTWSSNYQGVWHLHDDFLDDSGNSHTGTNNGSTDASPAKIGDGQNFVDPNHWIESTTFPNQTGDFTIAGWAYTTDNTRAGQRIFCDDAGNASGGYAMSIGDPGTGRIRFYIRGMSGTITDSPGSTISNNTWHYCVAVCDITGSMRYLYVDGALVASSANTGTLNSDPGNASIGGEVAAGETANRFHGDLDEIRLANTARSANWIATQYASQNQPIAAFPGVTAGDFYAVGNEMDLNPVSAANGDWDATATWGVASAADVPGLGARVYVHHQVDIDAADVDYICDCYVSNTAGNYGRLRVQNGYTLDITDSLYAYADNIAQITRIHLVNGTINVGGNMIMTRLATNAQTPSFYLRLENASDLNVTGNFVWNYLGAGAETDAEIRCEDNSTLDVTGDMTINHNAGETWRWNQDDNSVTTITGNLVLNSLGGDDLRIDASSSGTINVNGATGVTGNLLGGEDLRFELDGDGAFNIANNLSLTATGGDDVRLEVGNTVALSTFKVDVGGNATFIQNFDALTRDFQVYFYEDTELEISGDLTMTTNFTNPGILLLHADDNGVVDCDGDINLNAVSSGETEIRLDGNSELQIMGNFVRVASPNDFGELDCAVTATVEYNGNTAQIFSQDAGGLGDDFDYGIVEINNSFGTAPQLTMEGLATVHGSIIFMDGIISSTSTNLLVVDDDATSSGASDVSHVDGPIRKIGDDVFEFPVGDNGYWRPCSITAPNSTSDYFTAQYFEVDPEPTWGSPKEATIHHISDCEYWVIDRSPGGSDESVTLTYRTNFDGSIQCSGVTVQADLVVARWDGAMWRDEGTDGSPGGTPANGDVTTAAAVTSFSPFTLASITTTNPLPIELVKFDAKPGANHVELRWTTASEINNDYFTIEKSLDGHHWEEVVEVDGAGNSTSVINYSDKDYAPYTGISYYRLKQTDFDGSYSYSNVVSVLFDNGAVNVFPNPVQVGATLTIEAEATGIISLLDITGKIVFAETHVAQNGIITFQMPDVPVGVYFLRIEGQNSTIPAKLVVTN